MDYTDIIDVVCEMDRMMDALKEFGCWDEATALATIQRALTGSITLSLTDAGRQALADDGH